MGKKLPCHRIDGSFLLSSKAISLFAFFFSEVKKTSDSLEALVSHWVSPSEQWGESVFCCPA